jgi:hypothetical protein
MQQELKINKVIAEKGINKQTFKRFGRAKWNVAGKLLQFVGHRIALLLEGL